MAKEPEYDPSTEEAYTEGEDEFGASVRTVLWVKELLERRLRDG